jgi:hypothetical protein
MAQMKMAIALPLLLGPVVSLFAQVDSTPIAPPVWIIVVTITDVTTGKQIEQQQLDSELEFEDQLQCESVLAKVAPIPERHHLAAVLTCREVTRT